MQPIVRILDPLVVNQIAAGEVVERPASVVKELVENALDAGARTITVELEGGGAALVRVVDDGAGMLPEDATLAVRRHATSKLGSIDDLDRMQTLGFRGEALPSIGAVSRLTLTTRARPALEATRVRLEGETRPHVEPCGAPPGTTVEVRDLFFNVPARRKFLRATSTESSLALEVCTRAALANPSLHLTVLRDGRRAREFLPCPDLGARARAVFPGARLIEVERALEGIRVHALLSPPEGARSGAHALHLFVNGRAVRDRALARAVAFAYGSVLPPGRYPCGVVCLTLDPRRVDVNVHPQKAEVRFAEPARLFDAVTRAIAPALSAPLPTGPRQAEAHAGATAAADADPWALVSAVRDRPGVAVGAEDAPWLATPRQPAPPLPVPPLPAPLTGAPAGRFARMRVLGQAQDTYLVCADDEGLHVIDQHAADERLRFAELEARYRTNRVVRQRLLFPERLELTDGELALLEASAEPLATAGFEWSRVGPTTAAVHAVPALLARAAPARLVRDLLAELGRVGDRRFGDAVDRALATMACHAALRAGDRLSVEEGGALVRRLDDVAEFQAHCPHGRPVVWSMPYAELARLVGR